jgi:hypothetical protein
VQLSCLFKQGLIHSTKKTETAYNATYTKAKNYENELPKNQQSFDFYDDMPATIILSSQIRKSLQIAVTYLEEDKKRNSRDRISLGYLWLFFSFNLKKIKKKID